MTRIAAVARIAALLAVTGLVGLAATACGERRLDSTPPSNATVAPSEPRWQDAFDGTPELLLVVFPRELRKDPLYGSLLRRALEMARESSNAVAETRTLDAMEAADEVIVGARATAGPSGAETIVVVRGAPADVDPARLVDPEGHLLWTAGPPTATERARELVRAATAVQSTTTTVPTTDAGLVDEGGPDASLFELPGGIWVIASGAARGRMRAAIARPRMRPGPTVADGVLAAARLDGAALVDHVPALHAGGLLAILGRRLLSATIALPPGSERGLQATLTYADEGAAMGAEDRARVVVDAIARAKLDARLGQDTWLSALSTAKIARRGANVVVDAPLPERLINVLAGLNQL